MNASHSVNFRKVNLFGFPIRTLYQFTKQVNNGYFLMTGLSKTKTLVTLLLDRSSSMEEIKQETIEGVNSYFHHLRGGGDDVRLSLVLFDSPWPGTHIELEKVFVGQKISKVRNLTSADFVPRGGTPLRDAIYRTIRAVELSIVGKDVKVVIAIQTDGKELNSQEITWAGVRNLITEKEAQGWQFNFMGAGLDAYEEGQKLGLSTANIMAYGKDLEKTRAAFSATAIATRSFVSGSSESTSYSAEQKAAAGDLWQK